MDISQEIAKRVEQLPPDLQERVLQFVTSLSTGRLVGEKGAKMLQFSSTLDPVSAREMTRAIEEECERIDAGEW